MKTPTIPTRLAAWLAVFFILAAALAACQSTPSEGDKDAPARPSNPGGPGAAINLTGDAARGASIFKTNCVACHGDQGAGGVKNPGSTDGTVPPLSPVDASLVSDDYKEFATNLDLFVEHGSTPGGSSPALSMPYFGDSQSLSPQEYADVLAYVISLNKK